MRGLELIDEMIERRAERGLDMTAIEVGIDETGVAAEEVDEDELRFEVVAFEVRLPRKKKRVEQQLIEMLLQFLRSEKRFELEIEMDRLHFLDRDDAALFVDGESVDAALHRDIPLAHPRPMHDMHLGAIRRILSGAQLGALRVDVLADPHAPESIAALDADAAVGRLVNEVADRADDLPFFVIHAHGYSS